MHATSIERVYLAQPMHGRGETLRQGKTWLADLAPSRRLGRYRALGNFHQSELRGLM